MYKVIHYFDGKIRGTVQLNKGDKVIVVQEVDKNWYFGCKGDNTGFIPISYVARDETSDLNDILLSIDSAVSKIRNTPDSSLSKEQRSAVRKLLKFRENVVEQEKKRQSILNSAQLCNESSKTDVYCHTRDIDLMEDGSNVKDCELPDSSSLPTECAKYDVDEELKAVLGVMECESTVHELEIDDIDTNCIKVSSSEQLIVLPDSHEAARYLVECVRVHTQANNDACLRTVHNFVTYFEQYPLFGNMMTKLGEQLFMLNDTDNANYGFEESQDWHHIDRILCSAEQRCADLQRRGAHFNEDAEMLNEEHSQLVELLTKADPNVVRSRLCHADMRSFLALVALYEFKKDASTRRTLLPVFDACVKVERSCLSSLVSRSCFLSELLLDGCPMDVNGLTDEARLFACNSLSLFSTIISPGFALCNDLVRLFCGKLLACLLTLIDSVEDSGQFVTNAVHLILAFHLCLKNEEEPDHVLCSLLLAVESHAIAVEMCIARLFQMFASDEDPCQQLLLCHSLPLVNSLSQFIRDLFSQPDSQRLVNYQHCDVLVDIMNHKLTSLTPENSIVSEYILLLDLFVRNSLYTQRMYKSSDLRRSLRRLVEMDGLSNSDKIAAKNLSQILFRGVSV